MYVEETISKYEKYINPAQAKLFRFMGLASVERYAEGWTITDSEGKQFIDCLGGYGMFALAPYVRFRIRRFRAFSSCDVWQVDFSYPYE